MSRPPETGDIDVLVLAGGESKRMGIPKAVLPWGDITLIGAVVAILRPLFRKVMVVARTGEGLTGLGVEILTDDRPERGPLVGLARGLAASDAQWCFVVGCDMPFLRPDVIGHMAEDLERCEILVPCLGGRLQPLHAFYSRECLPRVLELMERRNTSLHALLSLCQVRTMAAGDFVDIDPELLSFRDMDTKDDYSAAWEVMRGSQQHKVGQ